MPRKFKVTVNNVDYDVDVLEIGAGSPQAMPSYTPIAAQIAPISSVPAAAMVAAAPSAKAGPAGAGDQCAQMGGVVVNIPVKQGHSVNEGDVVVELEAMKMKVPVIANRSGQVARILVAVGDGVENGQALLTIA